MIDISKYSIESADKAAIEALIATFNGNLSLEQLWSLMDQAWDKYKLDNRSPNPKQLAAFYQDPVWLLNGIFIEQDYTSMEHRRAIAEAVAHWAPMKVMDFGGGFGTLSRLLAASLPTSEITIFEPYPPKHGIESCRPFKNISFVNELTRHSVDVLVSTDVLEHVMDPLILLAALVDVVRPGGHLLIANCFYPVIACHLPATFHLRDSFDQFCIALGLEVLGPCENSHATIFRRSQVIEPDWPKIRTMERWSKRNFAWREFRGHYLDPRVKRGRQMLAMIWGVQRQFLRVLTGNK